MPFGYQKNKCKVFKIILEDLKRNHCEMMALMCLCMLTGVVTHNIETQLLELILMITEVVQTNVEDKEDNIIIPIEAKTMNQFQTLDYLSPPKVD